MKAAPDLTGYRLTRSLYASGATKATTVMRIGALSGVRSEKAALRRSYRNRVKSGQSQISRSRLTSKSGRYHGGRHPPLGKPRLLATRISAPDATFQYCDHGKLRWGPRLTHVTGSAVNMNADMVSRPRLVRGHSGWTCFDWKGQEVLNNSDFPTPSRHTRRTVQEKRPHKPSISQGFGENFSVTSRATPREMEE